MELNYFKQLTEEEIVEMINFCIASKNEESLDIDKRLEIDTVNISCEEDRVDLNGKRYARVLTAKEEGNVILSCYRATDFTLSTDDISCFPASYDEEMKMYMSKRFGAPYLQALYAHRLVEANEEIAKLANFALENRNVKGVSTGGRK